MPRKTAQEIGEEWEREIRDFFNKIGFHDVDGGTRFRPGGVQIDGVAGMHNVLFVIECKTKRELGNRDTLKAEVERFRKNSIKAIRAMKEGYSGGKYSEYNHFILLLATKEIIIKPHHLEALRSPLEDIEGKSCLPVFLFEGEVLDYYKNIQEELSDEISKIQLLADYRIRFPKTQIDCIIALKSTIKGMEIYNFVIAPQKLLRIVNVSRRESRRKEAYQRMIKGKRCQEIIDYLDAPTRNLFPEGPLIPGNIILAADMDVEIEEGDEIGLEQNEDNNLKLVPLGLPNSYGALEIIDGQHRLYAYSKNSKTNPKREVNQNDRVFVTLLRGSRHSQHRKIFIDLNDLQKGIDKNYIIDMIGEDDPTGTDGRISNIIKELNNLESIYGRKNYFFHNIKIPSLGIRGRNYSMKGLYQAIKRRNLAIKWIRERVINPFTISYRNIDFRDEAILKKFVVDVAKGLAHFFSFATKILGEELSESRDSPKYDLLMLLEGRGKEGLVDVLIGFYERMIRAKYIKEKKAVMLTKDDFETYLRPLAEYIKEIKTKDDFNAFIETAGHGPRDDTVRRMCGVLRNAGYLEFDFPDLDSDIKEIAEQTMDLEKKLRELIHLVMKDYFGEDWCKKSDEDVFPSWIFETTMKFLKEDIERNPNLIQEGKLYTGLTLGMSAALIAKKWMHFENLFVVGGKNFSSRDQFQHAVTFLSRGFRGTDGHRMAEEETRQIFKSAEQKEIASNYLKLFNKVFVNLPEQLKSSQISEESDEEDEEQEENEED